MVGLLVPAASTLVSKGVSSLFANKKDPQRIQAAQDALQRALAGDASALAYMQSQAVGSATQVGKDAFKAALAAYAANRTSFTPPLTATPLQQTVASTVDSIKQDLATGVQRIGAGASSAAANSISPNAGALTVPLDRNMLLLLGAVAAAIIFFRK